MALQDIKEEEPEMAYSERQDAQIEDRPVTESKSMHVVGLGMMGVEGVTGSVGGGVISGSSRDTIVGELADAEEALLPPLPDVNGVVASTAEELVGPPKEATEHSGDDINVDRNANATSVSLESGGTADSVLSSAMERASEPDTSFDLSKALEIPHDSTNSNPITPVITSPKLSLKRKFSSSIIMPVVNNNNISNTGVVDANGNTSNGNSATSTVSQAELPLHRTSTRSSSNSTDYGTKNNSPINILPRLSANLESAAALVKEQMGLDTTNSTVRKPPRKFSFGSSSSSSHSFHDNDELVYKPPPTLLEGDYELQVPENNSMPSSPSLTSLADADSIHSKRVPLLRRASSAILRKTSLSRRETPEPLPALPSASLTPSPANELRQTTSFSALAYESDLLTKQRCKNKRKLFIRTALTSTRSFSSPEKLNYSTPLSATPAPLLSGDHFTLERSLGSKFKRGFTRIISGSPSDKTHYPRTSADGISIKDQNQVGLSTTPSSTVTDSPLLSSLEDTNSFEPPGNNSRITPFSDNYSLPKKSTSFSRPSIINSGSSTPTVRQVSGGKRNPVGKKNSNNNKKNNSTTASLVTGKDNSVFSVNDTSGSISNESENEEITVDIDAITKALPVITITEKFGAKNATPIQTQSNIGLDRIYQEDSRQTITSSSNLPDEQKPSKISLREYIDILIKQQRVEDERFAVLEKNFTTSGWCSQDDIINIKQKRIVINKKWAERISYYQNRLEV